MHSVVDIIKGYEVNKLRKKHLVRILVLNIKKRKMRKNLSAFSSDGYKNYTASLLLCSPLGFKTGSFPVPAYKIQL